MLYVGSALEGWDLDIQSASKTELYTCVMEIGNEVIIITCWSFCFVKSMHNVPVPLTDAFYLLSIFFPQ